MFFIFFKWIFLSKFKSQKFEFPSGTDLTSHTKVASRFFNMFRDRALQHVGLGVKSLSFSFSFDTTYGNYTCIHNYCILKAFCMHLAHLVLSDGWHLRSKMSFIIILWKLIDMLFDQRRYPGWICVPRCQKCRRSSRRIASSVSIIAVCSLRFHSLSPCFFSLSLTYLNHISLSRLCSEKGQAFSPILFSNWCVSQSPPVVAEMDPGLRLQWTRERKLSKIPFCSADRLI